MKTYKLNPKPVDKNGKEVDVHPEDRTVVITEEIKQSLLDQLPENVRNEISNEPERVTVGNLKEEHEQHIESAKSAIKEANKIAQKMNDISGEFPELGLTGLASLVLDTDTVQDLDSKKAVKRKPKEK